MDKTLHTMCACQTSQQSHARALELQKEHGKLRQQEKAISKKRWDEYRTGAAKTAFADSIEPSAPASMTDFNPATVTAEIALTLKGKNLAAPYNTTASQRSYHQRKLMTNANASQTSSNSKPQPQLFHCHCLCCHRLHHPPHPPHPLLQPAVGRSESMTWLGSHLSMYLISVAKS